LKKKEKASGSVNYHLIYLFINSSSANSYTPPAINISTDADKQD